MLKGDKVLAEPFDSARDDAKARWLAAALWVACAALVMGLVRWAG
jgi:hypothetical protein